MKTFAKMITVGKTKDADDGDWSISDCFPTKFAVAYAKQIDRMTINAFYDAYKDSEAAKILLIDRDEFERFLKKMLPIWRDIK